MATRSSTVACTVPWTEGPGGLQSTGLQESDTTWRLNRHHHHSCISMVSFHKFLTSLKELAGAPPTFPSTPRAQAHLNRNCGDQGPEGASGSPTRHGGAVPTRAC